MDLITLTAKAALAVMLLIAGAAKAADLASFAAAVRLLVPFGAPRQAVRGLAAAIALLELALGAASLSSPALGWLNPAVFALACGFVAVAAAGFLFRRGRSCRCFGALSNRRFDARGLARSLGIAVAAGVALPTAPPAMVDLSLSARLLLLAAGGVTALAAYSAARALGQARKLEPEAS